MLGNFSENYLYKNCLISSTNPNKATHCCKTSLNENKVLIKSCFISYFQLQFSIKIF